MGNKPVLMVGAEDDGMPTAAICLGCLEVMATPDPNSLSADDNLKWFKAHFDLHVRLKHPDDSQNETLLSGEDPASHIH